MKKDSEKQLQMIRSLIESKMYTDAAEKIQAYKAVWNNEVSVSIMEAECMLMLERPEQAMDCVREGLSFDSSNYELYFMLGEGYELLQNYSCAGLCYRYAVFLCDQEGDLGYLQENMDRFQNSHKEVTPQMGVLLTAADNLDWLKMCTQLLAMFNPLQSIEIIFLELEPSEEVKNWIREHFGNKSIKCAKSKISPAYNQGIEAANSLSDILLIEDGVLPLEHSLFMLQLALYQTPEAAAVKSISRVESDQRIIHTMEDAMEYAHEYNTPQKECSKNTLSLSGPIVLIRRTAIKQLGWFDEGFTHRSCLVEDLGYRFISNKLKLLICENSLAAKIYDSPNLYHEEDLQLFNKKWNFNLGYSNLVRKDLMQLLHEEEDACIYVLEIGCACGATLLAIKNKYPNATVYGIELEEGPAFIAGKSFTAQAGNIEEITLDYPKEFFDYIIFGDVLEHLHNPGLVLSNMKQYLKTEGCILASIPNVMHISVVKSLLGGNWTYQEAGILDKTHLRFFTYREIISLFQNAGYYILEANSTEVAVSEEDKELINILSAIRNTPKNEFYSYQYLISAKKKSILPGKDKRLCSI